ncbi:MAG TPA: hypothetical protein VNB90_01520 [Cytophagaceae bacterium]|nr:hypothetical protein [Cytophagaceae bacterium]
MTNSEEEKYEQIELYINRQLSPQEQEAFEAAMNRDPELKQEVELYREAQSIMIDQGVLEVKMQLRNIHQKELRRMRGRKYFLGGAVLVIVSATLSYLYFTNPATTKTEEKNNTVADTSVTVQENTRVISSLPANSNMVTTSPERKANTSSLPVTSINTTITDTTSTAPVPAEEKRSNPENTSSTSPEPIVNTAPQGTNCAGTITGEVGITSTCKNESSGKIVVTLNSLRGGTKPYKFALDKDDEFRTNGQFTELEAGTYHVFVKDKNNCVSEIKQVEVTSKICIPPAAFKPEYGETWKAPEGINGQLKIMNRANDVVFSTTLHSNTVFEWNGNDQNGMSLATGAYHYMIITESGEVINGSVTILR